ncbi:MAG: hypothetical protein V9E91_10510 [Burkholderiaceae bacterium]|jgi:hypothetical protein|nr:hypothetical protein [Polaromonas sp.]
MSDTSKPSNPVHEQAVNPAFRALRITAPNLDAEQRMYNALLDELDAATQALESLKLLQEAHSQERDKKLRPLEQQARQLYAQIVEQLEQRLLNTVGLSKKHLADIETLVHAFSKVLNTPDTQRAATPFTQSEHPHISEQTTLDKTAEREAAKQAHQAKRQQAKQAVIGNSSSGSEVQNTPNLLRNMYRKLASALHPDRARDEAERIHKTALMGQVNAAHDAKDLLTLMRLQLLTQTPESPTESAYTTSIPKDKLKQAIQQLQAQLHALRVAWQQMQTSMQEEWDLPYGNISAKSLQMALRKEAQEFTSHIAYLQSDALWLSDDAFLKNWLSQQASMFD